MGLRGSAMRLGWQLQGPNRVYRPLEVGRVEPLTQPPNEKSSPSPGSGKKTPVADQATFPGMWFAFAGVESVGRVSEIAEIPTNFPFCARNNSPATASLSAALVSGSQSLDLLITMGV